MRVVHLLRKYDPAEWGGTETAVQRLFDGLRQHQVMPVMYCPRVKDEPGREPPGESDCTIRRFKAVVPIWGISRQRKCQLIAVEAT